MEGGGDRNKKPLVCLDQGFLCCKSLTITYFHTGFSTIIGEKSFHGPVRDGKGWYQDAMDTRLKLACYGCGKLPWAGAHDSKEVSFGL